MNVLCDDVVLSCAPTYPGRVETFGEMFCAVSNQWDQQFSSSCLDLKIEVSCLLICCAQLQALLGTRRYLAPIHSAKMCSLKHICRAGHEIAIAPRCLEVKEYKASVASLEEWFCTLKTVISSTVICLCAIGLNLATQNLAPLFRF